MTAFFFPLEVPVTDKPRRSRYVAKSRGVTYLKPEQAARAYAEAWYQALRAWRVQEVVIPSPRQGSSTFGASDWGDYNTLGEPGRSVARYLVTPYASGEGEAMLTEGEVGGMISLMVRSGVPEAVLYGRMLERLRKGTSMQSLVREGGGWAYPREQAVRYALAVLTLAVRLRDARAEGFLRVLQRNLAETASFT